jgi:mono/diheme cytochrome c family protein
MYLSTAVSYGAPSPVTFSDVTTQVFSQKCVVCHTNPTDKPKKPFDLNIYESAIRGVVPGDLNKSAIYQMMLQGKMPPPKALVIDPTLAITQEDVDLVAQWITDGAVK